MRLYYKPLVMLIWLGAGGHGGRRRAVALGSPPARGRAEAGQGQGEPRSRRRSRLRCDGSRSLVLALPLAAWPRAWPYSPTDLPDATLETRARVLSKELRCMVCQNQSIDDSDAPLARDLRVLVRERLRRATATSR